MAKTIVKSFRYRIYPTRRQAETLNNQLAICCELYNAALQERRDAWKINGVSIRYESQTLQLKEIKATRPDVAQINIYALENVLKRVDKAFDGFFRRVKIKQAGYPRFKPTRRYDSLRSEEHTSELQSHS